MSLRDVPAANDGEFVGDAPDARLLAEDDEARERALDVNASFLVQAPAGSGKTELLIQRFLALLAGVDEPGRIVALTFTKKAAGEMRERVLVALQDAARGEPPEDRPHARLTRTLADRALAQDRRRGWSLTEHPARLRIQTFDALATTLAQRAPLAAGLGPHPGYVDDATVLYQRAAEEALVDAQASDANWRTLLLHLENDAPRVVKLLAGMLARRDQWLRQVTDTPLASLREGLERALRAEIVEVLTQTRNAFPPGSGGQIAASARDAADGLARLGREDDARALEALAAAGGLPPATVDALPHWRTLGAFVMVKDREAFRRSVNRNHGFEPPGKGEGAALRRERKEAMESLCRGLDAIPGLAGALNAASGMPEPQIADASWRIVEALVDVVKQAAARLTTVFASERRVDFTQANLAALEALGDRDAPSELLLQLDANVAHLLVDEFQDTSFVQLRMLERLTAGWSEGDGRTLFAVGDPMQSIYRFREAEVGFFLDAQWRGAICGLPVETLRLRRNFRSQANLVDWCSATFAQVLGRVRDPARGIVPFEPAVAARPALDGVHATVERVENRSDEAARVVALIRDAQAAGAADIAILVRARSHLSALLPALRRERIAFAAIELDLLSQRQAIVDLTSLTHALLQPADRLAWLSVLRAPWCGLALLDLVTIAAAAPRRHASPARALDAFAAMPGLSADGRARLARVMPILRAASDARGEATVAARVRGAWLALGGPGCLDDPVDLDAASLFFDLLAEHERAGDVADWDAFVAALGALHASPAVTATRGVQIMTMHKAKGLEFDTVILAGLANEGRRPDPALLRWRRRRDGLLIAPSRPRGGDDEPLYRYLGDLEAAEEDAELGRLLYVACTRARQRLHLVGAPGTHVDERTGVLAWDEPAAGSSLRKLAAVLAEELPLGAVGRSDEAVGAAREAPPLRRLPLAATLAAPEPGVPAPVPDVERDLASPPFDWARETTRRIGTLAHRLLARIADDGLDAWPATRIGAMKPRIRAALAAHGFTADELPAAAARVLAAIERTIADAPGRWLFDPSHEDARSEWALSGVDGGEIVRVVVDRTFVCDGERWIVDYKTGTHEGGDTAAFLDSEVERYRPQLERYGRMMQRLDGRPVRLALYYPLVDGGFREITTGRVGLSSPTRQLTLFDADGAA